MAIRERVKRVFRRSAPPPAETPKPRILRYRPGEVPRSKYRGPVDPEHKKRLEAWSFETAFHTTPRPVEEPPSPFTIRESFIEEHELPPSVPVQTGDGVVHMIEDADDNNGSDTDFSLPSTDMTDIENMSDATTAFSCENEASSSDSDLSTPLPPKNIASRRNSIVKIKPVPAAGKRMPFATQDLAVQLAATRLCT